MGFVSQTTVPHLAFPWRMVVQPDGSLAANCDEQDSLDEILSCVQEIAACPIGAWADQPAFGVPSEVFAQTPLGTTGLTQAIARWEPRAVAVAQEYPDQFDAATRHITVTISSITPDQ